MRRSALIAALAVSGCAAQPGLIKPTASGYPEETLSGVTVDGTKAALMERCAGLGALVQEASSHQVLCGKVLSGGDAVLAQLLIGNSYSTTPEQKIRFTIYQSGTNVRVTAQQWVETQMAFGQMRRTELNGNAQRNSIQALLSGLPGSSTNQLGAAAAARAMSPPPSAVEQPTGKDAVVAEKTARDLGCTTADTVSRLIGKGPGYESYSFQCLNGETLILRCEFGTCRALR